MVLCSSGTALWSAEPQFEDGFVYGIDSVNDSAFINETLIGYCVDRGVEFTRSRAYRSNDQAWIEQKNGSVVRRFVGHDRYSGQVAGQTMQGNRVLFNTT